MLRRLRIYFVGFGLGLLAVYVLFSGDDRNLDIWTPEQRILEAIRNDSVFLASSKLSCYVECLELDEATLHSLWTDAQTKSLNPGGNPYRYLIVLKTDEENLEAEIEWDKKKRTLLYIRSPKNPKACQCDD